MPHETGSVNSPIEMNRENYEANKHITEAPQQPSRPKVPMQAKSLVERLVEVAAAVDHVDKQGTAPDEAGGYSYMKAKDIAHAFRKEFAQRGIQCMGSVIHTERWSDVTKGGKPLQGIDVTMRFTFHDAFSEAQLSVDAVGSGLGGDKAVYKAQTGALKYALRSAFLVPDEAADAEEEELTADTHEYVKAPQRKVAATTLSLPEGYDDGYGDDAPMEPAEVRNGRPEVTRFVRTNQQATRPARAAGKSFGPPRDPEARISDAQRKRLFAISRNAGVSDDDVHEIISPFGYTSTNEIQKGNYDKICALVESGGLR